MTESYLTINFNDVKKNITLLAKEKKPCLVVKANCYGLGDFAILKLINMGYDFFAVSTYNEAVNLRKLDDDIDILILTPTTEINKDFIHTVDTIEHLKDIDPTQRIHLKFDTGMGRLGFQKEKVKEIHQIVKDNKLNVNGIYSHFHSADNEKKSQEQIKEFKDIVDYFSDINIKYIHIQNTLGALKYEIDYVNMVRPGIGIWGYFANQKEKCSTNILLNESLALYAKVIHDKIYFDKVSYNQLDKANGRTLTLRIGYADGLFPKMRGYEFKNGARVIGQVCMCQTIIEYDNKCDYFEIFGKNESIYDIIERSEALTYNFLVNLSERIEKIEGE